MLAKQGLAALGQGLHKLFLFLIQHQVQHQATPNKGRRQGLFIVGGDDDQGRPVQVGATDSFAADIGYLEAVVSQGLQQAVGHGPVCLVDLVDQQEHAVGIVPGERCPLGHERLLAVRALVFCSRYVIQGPPQRPGAEVCFFVSHTPVRIIGIGEPAQGIIAPEQILGLGTLVDHQGCQGHSQDLGRGPGDLGLADARLAADQEGTLDLQGRQDGNGLLAVEIVHRPFGPGRAGIQADKGFIQEGGKRYFCFHWVSS